MPDGCIDHLWFRVRDPAASKRFYTTIAPHAGLRIGVDEPDHVQVAGPDYSFSLIDDGRPLAQHVHLAFRTQDDATVREFHSRRARRGLRGPRRSRRAPRLPPGLLRRVRPGPRRAQHRGRQPQPLSQAAVARPADRKPHGRPATGVRSRAGRSRPPASPAAGTAGGCPRAGRRSARRTSSSQRSAWSVPNASSDGATISDARWVAAKSSSYRRVAAAPGALVLARVVAPVPQLRVRVMGDHRAGQRVLQRVEDEQRARHAGELQPPCLAGREAVGHRRGHAGGLEHPRRLDGQHAGAGQQVLGVRAQAELLELGRQQQQRRAGCSGIGSACSATRPRLCVPPRARPLRHP